MATCEAGRSLPVTFEKIFREHSEFVYRTARRVLGNIEDAEDVVQTVFVRLLRHDQAPEFAKNPRAYLYRAAVNTSLNVIRSRRPNVPASHLDNLDDGASWRQAKAEQTAREEFWAVLADLNTRTAEIFILRYVHGFSDSEIAKLLGVSRGTIAVTLFRARARLRKLFRSNPGEST